MKVFKVGQRVKVIKLHPITNPIYLGLTGTVIKLHKDTLLPIVQFKDIEHTIFCNWELAEYTELEYETAQTNLP